MSIYSSLFLTSTDTVAGIGAPFSEQNRITINKLKHSPLDKELVVMVSSIKMAEHFFGKKGFDDAAKKYAEKYWPGAVTLVCSSSLALRMPKNDALLDLIGKIGPVYMTSANMSGKRPLSLQEAKAIFPEIKKVYDFGVGSGKPSRIIDVATGEELRK